MAAIAPIRDKDLRALTNLGWREEQIDVIRRSVAKDATSAELYQFLYLCKTYRLDPFRREIHFFKDKRGNPSIITGIDGFRKSARHDPAYEGIMAFAVREGDVFALDPANYNVTHKFGAKRGRVIGAWARADAKGRRPVLVYIDFNEYNRPTHDSWRNMPATMIAKVAESHAIRRQFGLSGLYTREEMGIADTAPLRVDAEVVDLPEVDEDSDCEEMPTDASETVVDDEINTDADSGAEPLDDQDETPESNDEDEAIDVEAPADSGIKNEQMRSDEQNRFKGFWASARNLGYSEADVHREAAVYFETPNLTSLTQIQDMTPAKIGQFLLHLRDLRAGGEEE